MQESVWGGSRGEVELFGGKYVSFFGGGEVELFGGK
jgi:hypothetical protein